MRAFSTCPSRAWRWKSLPLHAASGSRCRSLPTISAFSTASSAGRNGRVGIQFDPNSNARAQVASYFRFFHKEVKPVLAR